MKKLLICLITLISIGLCAQNAPNPYEVEVGNFSELGFGEEYKDGALDVATKFNRRVLAGWVEDEDEDKNAAAWHSLDYYPEGTDESDFEFFVGDTENDEVATAVAVTEDYYYLAIVQTPTYDPDGASSDVGIVYKINFDDNAVVWSYTLPTNDGCLPRDMFIQGEHIYVLSQLTHANSGAKGLMFSSLDENGGANFNTPYYYPSEELGVEVTELHMQEEELVTVGNLLDINFPIVIAADPNNGSNTSNTLLANQDGHHLYGFDVFPDGRILAAGYEEDVDYSKMAINVYLNSNRTFNSKTVSPQTFECVYRDVTLYEEGFTSVGYIKTDNADKDIFTTEFDSDGEVVKSETVGEEDDEILYSSSLDDLEDSRKDIYSAGEYPTYGEEFGNAYLLATRGFLQQQSCSTLGRIMYVDKVVDVNPNTGAVNYTGTVLESYQTFADMLQTGEDNNIAILMLYDLDKLFGSQVSTYDRRATFQRLGKYLLLHNLTDFFNYISGLPVYDYKLGMVCGGSTYKTDGIDIMANLNTLEKEMGGPSYASTLYAAFFSRKMYALALEHEFWNVPYSEDMYGQPLPNLPDDQYTTVRDDHIALLGRLQSTKNNRPTFNRNFDYVSFLFDNRSGASTYDKNNVTNQRNIADDIKAKTDGDGVFLTYYQKHVHDEGTDFYWSTSSIDGDWTNRLIHFGDKSTSSQKINIFPLFSVEYNKNSSDNCYKTPSPVNYLGKYIFSGSSSTKDMGKVEDFWVNGGSAAHPTPPYPPSTYLDGYEAFYIANTGKLDHVQMAGFSYFTYSCFAQNAGNYVDNVPLINCGSNANYNDQWKKTPQRNYMTYNVQGLEIYPNPSSQSFKIISNSKGVSYRIFDLSGKLIRQGVVENQLVAHNIDQGGTYIVLLSTANGETQTSLFTVKQ